ncbi:PREDICTED: UPF0545 protein C22orf39 homolog [Dufourea novaeangliae]|uniref:UPF0545 protein C22orf39 homolog n=1 Tax=Dufourea novaeangliae TaxID=178035 RepID=UPI00076707C2|nr:PREDICTED: UPF0545 protein C22orf39 homolog [Dufourea novaeangliae]
MPDSDNTTKSASSEEKNTPDEKDTSNKDNQHREFDWMIRPCEIYNEEYKDCRSIRARFHQYFVFGHRIDCTQWKTDYHNCYLWEKYKSEKAYTNLIDGEKKRRMERLRPHFQNNVWQKRDKPPENWNGQLPDWLQTKMENTFLSIASDELKESKSKSSCTIM